MANLEKQLASGIMNQLLPYKSEPSIEHAWELKRMKSLDKWKMAKPSAREMAESGFYCPKPDQYPDTVRCFSCFIELDGWEPTDKPWEEHQKRALSLNPPCKFIEIGKKESDLTVDDFLEIQKSVMIRIVKNRCQKNLDEALSLHKKKKAALKKDLKKIGIA